MFDWFKRNHGFVAWAYALAVSVTTTILYLTGQANVAPVPLPGPPPPILQPTPGQIDSPYGMGWENNPGEVALVRQTLPIKVFADTPAGGLLTDDLPNSVYGWKAYVQLMGQPPPMKNQGQVGSCVSFGTDTAVERTLAAQIARQKGAKAEFTLFCEEATYGGSRVEIGGGRIRGDGSVGAWAAQWFQKYGGVPRKAYPSADLTTYSEARCRQWGSSGVPPEFEQVAKQFPVKSITQVQTVDEARKALAQGYFIAVCSNQGFTMQRDANGVCKPSGSWGHCMCLDGYEGTQYLHITNSWGSNAHTGPTGFGDPNPDGFWADAAVVDRMLKQGDSWAFSGVTGFPARKPLDWAIADPVRRHPLALRNLNQRSEVLLAW